MLPLASVSPHLPEAARNLELFIVHPLGHRLTFGSKPQYLEAITPFPLPLHNFTFFFQICETIYCGSPDRHWKLLSPHSLPG